MLVNAAEEKQRKKSTELKRRPVSQTATRLALEDFLDGNMVPHRRLVHYGDFRIQTVLFGQSAQTIRLRRLSNWNKEECKLAIEDKNEQHQLEHTGSSDSMEA